MMTTNQMSEMMQSFFEDYNGKNDEINRLNDELAAVKAELAKLGIEFDRINIEFRKATEELEETRKKLAETEQELGETKEKLSETEQKLSETERKLKIANEIIADIRPKERADFGVRSFKYLGEMWYPATDLLYKKGYKKLNLRSVLGKEVYLAHARKFRYSDMYDRIESGKIRMAPTGEVWCVDEVGARVILQKVRYERKHTYDIDKIVKLYEGGMSRYDIAREIGCCYDTVKDALNKSGYARKRTNIDATEIIRLYESGMSRYDIVREIGCCYDAVCKVLLNAGYGKKHGKKGD